MRKSPADFDNSKQNNCYPQSELSKKPQSKNNLIRMSEFCNIMIQCLNLSTIITKIFIILQIIKRIFIKMIK